MWIKIALAVAIVAFCTFVGYLVAGRYRARHQFYEQFCAFNERYLNELNFTRKPVAEFLRAQTYTGDFDKTIKKCLGERERAVRCTYLTKEEQADCNSYFVMLGKGDSLSQRNYFTARQQYLCEKKGESEKQLKSRGSLCVKLGLLAGLAIVILII